MKDKMYLKQILTLLTLSIGTVLYAQTGAPTMYRSLGSDEMTKEYIEVSPKGDSLEYVVYGIDDSSYSYIAFYKYSFITASKKYTSGDIGKIQFSYTKYRPDLFENINNLKIFCPDWVVPKDWYALVRVGPFVSFPWGEDDEYDEKFMRIILRPHNDYRSNYIISSKLYKLIEDSPQGDISE